MFTSHVFSGFVIAVLMGGGIVMAGDSMTNVVPVGPVQPVKSRVQVRGNRLSFTNDVTRLPLPGVQAPGAHSVVTNAEGQLVHRFSMRPVVTNEAAFTNSLESVQQRQTELQRDLRGMVAKEAPLRRALAEDYQTLLNIATNFVPEGAEGKRLMMRIAEVEKELKGLREQLVKKLEAEPAYASVKARVDTAVEELKAIKVEKNKLLHEARVTGAELNQLKVLEKEPNGGIVSEEKPKAGTP